MSYKFSNNSRVLVNNSRVVLGNRGTGDWIKVSKQVYDILNIGVEKKLSIKELNTYLYDEDDCKYINTIYDNLCYLGIIEDENNMEILGNKIVSLEITHRCNLSCTHCCIDADGIVSGKKDLTTIQIKEILNKIIEWNPKKVMLSGGEPMVRNDFLEILEYLRRNYKGYIVISTNGTCINKKNVDYLLKNANQIDMSLDGVDEETCSKIRGKGVFDKVINSINLLKSKGFERITLSMVISDKNEHLRNPFIELCNKLDVKPVIRGFYSIGRGEVNKGEFLNNDENQSYISKELTKKIGICNCSAMQRELFIGYDGSIYPCPTLIKSEYLLGNILSLKKITDLDIFKKEKKADLFLDIIELENFRKCKDCKVNLFCLSCPGVVEKIKEDKLAIENRCKVLKPALYKQVWEELV